MSLETLDALVEGGYPRPQLVRVAWADLSGEWEFGRDPDDVGVTERWFAPECDAFDSVIEVPYPPESARSGLSDRRPHPVVWYRRRVRAPERGGNDRLLLHFGAVDYRGTVWVNGHHLGEHRGGHTPFHFDVTEVWGDGPATVVVRAEDRADDLHQPRGKQDWKEEPHRVWYHRTTGLWQPVWLEVVPSRYLDRLVWSSDVDNARVDLDAEVVGPPGPARLRLRLRCGGELLADQDQEVRSGHVRMSVAVPALEEAWAWEGLLWSAEQPNLVEAELTLYEDASGVIGGEGAGSDRVWSYLGLRTVGAEDGRFLVNHQVAYLRMVLAQGYWPESHLAAPEAKSLRAEVELIRSLGFNAARLHQKVEDPRFLYWADRLGLMVWDEMPSAGAFSARALERLVAEWTEVVERDRSHPCVVAWVPFNESWGVPSMPARADQRHAVAALSHLTRAYDPTRPVVSNDGWEHVDSDVWGVHDYAADGATLRARYGDAEALRRTLTVRQPSLRRVVPEDALWRGQPVILSEFGGVALSAEPDPEWHGYSVSHSPDELAERLEDLFGAVRDAGELAGFCYTQLVDTEQESNGLCWPDRTPKMATERIRGIVTGERPRPPCASPRTQRLGLGNEDGP